MEPMCKPIYKVPYKLVQGLKANSPPFMTAATPRYPIPYSGLRAMVPSIVAPASKSVSSHTQTLNLNSLARIVV